MVEVHAMPRSSGHVAKVWHEASCETRRYKVVFARRRSGRSHKELKNGQERGTVQVPMIPSTTSRVSAQGQPLCEVYDEKPNLLRHGSLDFVVCLR